MNPASLSHLGFLTLPGYSMIAVTNAIEACRMANRCVGRDVYRWTLFGLDDAPVPASNGLTIAPSKALDPAALPDIVFACGGIDVRGAVGKPHFAALRWIARHGTPLGALCTGTFALAEAGLLDGYRCAVHWEDVASIREEFPDIELANELFVLDRDRLTCTGGVGPLDMMLFLIEAKLGRAVAEHVSTTFILDRIRASGERQPVSENDRIVPNQPLLNQAVRLIEDQIAEKQSMQDVADALGISLRQLQRLFRTHLNESPGAFAKELRLKRARTMLRQMRRPIIEVALACGFASSAYFSSAYRAYFGYSPSAERHLRAASMPLPPGGRIRSSRAARPSV